MGIFDYKHNKNDHFKARATSSFSDTVIEDFVDKNNTITTIKNDFFDPSLLESTLSAVLSSKSFVLNPVVDSELLEAVSVFSDNISETLPNFYGYLKDNKNGKKTVDSSVLLDAFAFLKSIDPSNLSVDFLSGQSQSISIEDGDYFITPTAKIYKNRKLVFDIEDPNTNGLSNINFKNKIIVFGSGIEIPFFVFSEPDLKTENSFYSFPGSNDVYATESMISDFVSDFLFDELILKNPQIKNKNSHSSVLDVSGASFDDLGFVFNLGSAKNTINSFLLNKANFDNHEEVSEFENCITGKIKFMYLLLLLILGGGKEGQQPIASKGSNAFNDNCERKAFNTWHNVLWGADGKKGIPISILQILYTVLSPFFGLNIDKWDVRICLRIKIFKKKIEKCWSWTIFEGWCICGHLELAILGFQEKISEEIRKMFFCKKVFLKPSYLNVSISEKQTEKTTKKPDLSELNSSELKQQVEEHGNIIKVINNY